MSRYDYEVSQRLAADSPSFNALLMAAMLRAGTGNLARLCDTFPDVRAELCARYDAPGGLLPGESAEMKEGPCPTAAPPRLSRNGPGA